MQSLSPGLPVPSRPLAELGSRRQRPGVPRRAPEVTPSRSRLPGQQLMTREVTFQLSTVDDPPGS